MAPSTLRSSAPNTPTDKSSDTSTVTPRKVPQCSKCKRPKQGHPRSGCPYVDSPLKDKNDIQTTPAMANNMINALGSMHIA
ncbi:hypothetical protein L208DRAFT_996994, partial [Tricholoma matsutake]